MNKPEWGLSANRGVREQSRVAGLATPATCFLGWGHFLAATNDGINGKYLINGTVP